MIVCGLMVIVITILFCIASENEDSSRSPCAPILPDLGEETYEKGKRNNVVDACSV